MNKLLLIVSLLMLFSFTTADNKDDRKDAINYFKETRRDLAKEISGLTEAQLNWQPADSVWSIAACVEHIAISEKNLFDWAMSTLKEPANAARRSELKADDEGVKKMITDRSFKVKTTETFKPTGQFGNVEGSYKAFNERRTALINYMDQTQDDLRNHFATTPMGLLDIYQLLIFLSGHTKRHTMQIAAVKAMPGFPGR